MSRGKREELAALYETYAPGAVRLAYMLTGDLDEAQDIANDAFIRISSRIFGLRRPDQFSAYLYRTVVNVSRSRIRKHRRELAHIRAGILEQHSELPDLAAREALWRALLRLPLRQRTAVFLRFYEDLTEAEAANALECSVGCSQVIDFQSDGRPA